MGSASPTVQFYRTIFDEADIDHDGQITIQELQTMIRRSSFTEDPIPPQIVERIYEIADTNHDGQLNFNEFVKMTTDPKNQSIFGRYVTKYVHLVVPKRKKLGGGTDEPDAASSVLHFDGAPFKNWDNAPPNIAQSYEEEYSCWPPKLGMIIISVIELIFFLIDEFNEENSTNFGTGPMAKIFIYEPTKRYQVWRYLTYMLVHIGYLHLVVNLVVQVFIGIPLEMVHGWWRVLLIYFTGVVAGSLGTSITDPTSMLAGASGGVYSLITAHIATIIMNWSEMTFPALQLIIFLLLTGADVGTSIYNRYWANMEEHIGYVAHFAGALAGLLVGILVLRNLNLTKKENILWWIAVAMYVMLMLVGICWNIFYTEYFPKQI